MLVCGSSNCMTQICRIYEYLRRDHWISVLFCSLLVTIPLGIRKRRWEDNIKMVLKGSRMGSY
jgi:hypothetical protein